MGLFYFMEIYLFKSENLSIKEIEWNTPNTYGNNYKSVPKKPGVYLLVHFENLIDYDKLEIKPHILYVGSSINLNQRREKHEVKRSLSKIYNHVFFILRKQKIILIMKLN